MVDVDKPHTFLKFLKAMDYPFIELEWNLKVDYCRKHNYPDNYVIGKYIATMRLAAYRKLGYGEIT